VVAVKNAKQLLIVIRNILLLISYLKSNSNVTKTLTLIRCNHSKTVIPLLNCMDLVKFFFFSSMLSKPK